MSDSTNTQTHKPGNKNQKGLGRGLGSLLGNTGEGAFSKTADNGEEVLQKLVEKQTELAPPKAPSQVAQSKPTPTPAAPNAKTFNPVIPAEILKAVTPAAAAVPAPAPTSVTPAAAQVQTSTPQAAAPSPAPAAAPVLPVEQTSQPVVTAPAPALAAAPVQAVPAHLRIWQIPIEKIEPNPKQPRQVFDREALQELGQSIKEKGIIQPLLVRKSGPEKFEIIAGERRWRAAQIAGLKEVPAVLKDIEGQEVLELALIENIQRENLNPVEEAEAYDFLIQKYNLTQQELATKVGKERATIANVLRLLQLDPKVRQMVSNKELSLGQAKVLLGLQEPRAQQILAQKAVKESLSVRALEKLVQREKPVTPGSQPKISDDEALRNKLAQNLGEEMQKLIGSKVVLDYDKGKGKLQIHFYSDQELNQIADRLRESWQN